MARQRFLNPGVGERLLAAKLRLLSGSSERGTSAALSILTGAAQTAELPARPTLATPARPTPVALPPARSHYAARTVYLSERHLRAIDRISAAWQQPGQARRASRSAVLRGAIEHLLVSVEAETAAAAPPVPETSPLENL